MRIEHLLELVNPSVTKRNTNLTLRKGNDYADNVLGQGGFSTVIDDKTDPHMVRKHHHTPLTPKWNDAFVQFVTYLINNNLSAVNLPRIYNVTEISDKNGHKIYKFQVEKLIPETDVSLDELKALVDRTISVELNYDKQTSEQYLRGEILYQLGVFFEEAVQTGDYSHIIDEEVVKTLKIIESFLKKAGHEHAVGMDISNPSNIMFRRGRYGLQLVISDPFA